MKLIARGPSKKEDTTLLTVQMNLEEAKILHDLVLHASMNAPKIFQLMSIRARLKSMFKTFAEML